MFAIERQGLGSMRSGQFLDPPFLVLNQADAGKLVWNQPEKKGADPV